MRGAVAILMAVAALCAAASPAPAAGLTSRVDPFIGTDAAAPDFRTGGGAGATLPGAAVPFGMVQFSPDTLPGTAAFGGGYAYGDRRLRGFSTTHVSGTGCAVFQDIPLLPVAVPVDRAPTTPGSSDVPARYVPRFDHVSEAAAPGAYRVVLDPGTPRAIGAELTATTRTGVARLRFPPGRPANVLIDAGGSAMANGVAGVRVDPVRREVSATAESGRFCHQSNSYKVHVVARFSAPLRSWGTWRDQDLRHGRTVARDTSPAPANVRPIPGGPPARPGNPSTTAQAGAYVSFAPGATVEVRIGVSFVSVAGARRNLETEAAGRPFAELRAAARRRWEAALSRVRVHGGTGAQRTIFTTALYHALLHPNVVSDADGRYPGMDGRVHRATGWTKRSTISGWDSYRTQAPLLAMLYPRDAADVARSLIADARESGCLPKWALAAGHTNVMVGDPAAPILASTYAFGARGFDPRAALRAMLRGADGPCHSRRGGYVEREGLEDYLRLGYVPTDAGVAVGADAVAHTADPEIPWGPAATTLEYAIADFATSRLAAALGRDATAARLLTRSATWRTLVDPAAGAIGARRADGSFPAPYDPASGAGFVEGSAAQYGWLVPHDLAGLAASMGGRAAARARLESFFAQLDGGPASPHAFLGNEPSLGAPYVFSWLGEPWRGHQVLRRALLELYRATPRGLPGNDDAGALSAWWVLSALGIYPAIPGEDVLVLAAPLFPRAELRPPGARVTITGRGAAARAPHVRRVTVGGRVLHRAWLRWRDLRGAGRIAFAVGATPDRRWGARFQDAPPSFPPPALSPRAPIG